MDRAWWREHIDEVRARFRGDLACPLANCHGVRQVRFKCGRNSGLGAMALAAHWGAERILMLGYDCQHTGGAKHWHGNHPKGMGNAGKVKDWPAQFQTLADRLAGIDLINCTRETALTCFPRQPLERALMDQEAVA